MRSLLRRFAVFLLLFCVHVQTQARTPLASAESSAPDELMATACDETRASIGAIEYRILRPDHETCWHMLKPKFRSDLRYRDFLIASDGLVMVFSSYGPGPDDTTAGSREFYFFPRRQAPHSRLTPDGVRVVFANGVEATYLAKTARWGEARGATLRENPAVKPGDDGGWELVPEQGLTLDLGFRWGGSPRDLPTRMARFIDSRGEICEIANKEIFTWDESGESRLKFRTDAQLAEFLGQRCPNLIPKI